MTKISGQFLISGQFQDNFKISGKSGISGQLGALPMRHQTDKLQHKSNVISVLTEEVFLC